MAPTLVGPATESYEIPAMPAGTYDFVCTLHPGTMTGTLVIE
jgi:plastocyanin